MLSSFFFNNPIANMQGVSFLIFYVIISTILIIYSKLRIKSLDDTEKIPLPKITEDLDPYEVAFLRGGSNEVIRLALFNLLKKGVISYNLNKITPDISGRTSKTNLNTIETTLFKKISNSQDVSKLFNSSILVSIDKLCEQYKIKFETHKLIPNKEMKKLAATVILKGASFIFILGLYKLISAYIHGRSNVGILIFLMLFLPIILSVVCAVPKITKRGKNYVQSLQIYHVNLKNDPKSINEDSLTLAAGIFGMALIADTTSFGDFGKIFKRASSTGNDYSGGGCGSSCSSGGGDGGGSCGGGCGGCGGGGD